MLFHKILVTGCGSDIGLAVGRILQETKIADSVVGCDTRGEDHAGRVFFDRCFARWKEPHRRSIGKRLMQLVEDEQIDLVIPTSEPELRLLYVIHFLVARFLMANDTALEIGFDKYKTAEFLQNMTFRILGHKRRSMERRGRHLPV